MRRLILSLVLGIGLFIGSVQAQLEVVFTTSTTVIAPGGQVAVDVSVNNFDNLISAQWSINWDSLVLNYNSVSNVTGILQNFTQSGNIGTPDQGGIINPGQATVSWSLPSTNPRTIPDGTVLFTLLLDAVGPACSTTSLDVTTMPLNIEAIVDDGNFTDIGVIGMSGTLEVDCNGGGTPCGPNTGNPMCNTGTPGNVVLYGSENTVENGANVCIPITTDNFQDIQSIQFTLNWDVNLLTYTGVQNVCDDLAAAFTSNATVPGAYVFIWTSPDGIQTSNKNNGETIIEVCFDAIGGTNSFADVSFSAVEVGDSNQQLLDVFNDCGSVLVCPVAPPGDFTIKAGDAVGFEGDEVCVDVTACGFVDIASLQFTMAWDGAAAQYNNPNIQNIHPDFEAPLFNYFAPDNLRMSQSTGSTLGVDIPDNTVLFSVCFDLLGPCGTSPMTTAFSFIDVPGVDIQAGNGAGVEVPVLVTSGSITMNPCPTGCLITATNLTHPLCVGGTGTAELVLDMGVPTSCVWTYEGLPWTNSSPNPCEITAGLAGDYCVTVTNDGGAVCNTCFEIIAPTPIEFIGTDKDIDCIGPGTITISNITGGNGIYTCCWADGFLGCNRTITTPGNYTVTVKDTDNCTSTSMPFTIDDLTGPLAFTEVVEPAGCTGLGKITVNVTGGCPTYTYSSTAGVWVGNMLTDLPVGPVDVTVNDANFGTVTKTINITSAIMPLSVMADITHETCAGDSDGAIVLTVSGGCPTYSISPSTTTGLMPGEYTFTITDVQSSQIIAGPYTVNPGATVSATETVTNETSPGANDGMVCFAITGTGTGPYVITSTPAGGMQSGDCIEGLGAGEFVFTITDVNGCSFTTGSIAVGSDTVVVNPPVVTITVLSEGGFNGFGVSCFGECDGVIAWAITSSTNITSVTLTGPDGMEADSSMLCAGLHTLVVLDDSGNTTESQVTIIQDSEVLVNYDLEDDIDCEDEGLSNGAIDIEVSGGTVVDDYTYAWSNSEDTQDISGLSQGTYMVTVTDDNNCQDVEMIIVEQCIGDTDPPELCYTSNNIITPGVLDQINDVLEIECSGDRDNNIVIYDRWGRDVFTMVNYDNSWGGMSSNGVLLGEGTYYWVMDATFDNGETRLFKGYVTLLRDSE